MILHTGRREFIRDLSFAGAGLACGGCAGGLVANGSPDLTVGIVSDVHVPIAGEARMRLAFSLFDRRKVDAVMICGDLTSPQGVWGQSDIISHLLNFTNDRRLIE